MTTTDHGQPCQHPRFDIAVDGDRRVAADGTLMAVNLRMTCRCAACGLDFWFPGMMTGVSFVAPATDPTGFTATVPVVPANLRPPIGPELVGIAIRTPDHAKGVRR